MELKTISDINIFIDRLYYELGTIPPNLELKIKLKLDDYANIQKEFNDLTRYFQSSSQAHNTWITYQYIGIRATIELETI